jgi:hypothetical protein
VDEGEGSVKAVATKAQIHARIIDDYNQMKY